MQSSAPAAEIEGTVVDWLRKELDDPDITAADNFLDVGGHSLIFANLNAYLVESYGVVLDLRVTYNDTLAEAAVAAAAALPATAQTA
jgi:acyl carrier protein